MQLYRLSKGTAGSKLSFLYEILSQIGVIIVVAATMIIIAV
jgi:hypothetical protein